MVSKVKRLMARLVLGSGTAWASRFARGQKRSGALDSAWPSATMKRARWSAAPPQRVTQGFCIVFATTCQKRGKVPQKPKKKTKKKTARKKVFQGHGQNTSLRAVLFFWVCLVFLVPYSVFACTEENIATHMTSACALEQGRCIRLGMAVRDN